MEKCKWTLDGFPFNEPVKNYLADFFRQVGVPLPHPTPLAENCFVKKTPAEMGGTPPPLTENRRKFSLKMGQKGLRFAFFGQNFFPNRNWGVPPRAVE